MSVSIKEIKLDRRLKRRGLRSYRGTRTFLCLNADVTDTANALYGSTFEQHGGPSIGAGTSGPLMYDPEIIWSPGGNTSVALIRANYVTPGVTILISGQTRLSTRTKVIPLKVEFDLDGKPINGVGSDGKEYRMVAGDNTVHRAIQEIVLKTAFEEKDRPTTALPSVDSVNSSPYHLTDSWTASAGTLKYMGSADQQQPLSNMVPVDYHFHYLPSGWNNLCMSQEGTWVVVELKMYDTDGIAVLDNDEIQRKRAAKVWKQAQIEVDDLVDVGILGLMDAVGKFDENRKIKFKTYAEFRIKGAILDELREMDWVPRSIRGKQHKLENA